MLCLLTAGKKPQDHVKIASQSALMWVYFHKPHLRSMDTVQPSRRYPKSASKQNFRTPHRTQPHKKSSDFATPAAELTAPWPRFLASAQSARTAEWNSPGGL